MSALMLAINDAEIKEEAIPLHMHHRQTETKQLKDKGDIATVMVH